MAVVPETPVDPEEEPVVESDVPSSEGEESYDEEVDTESESVDEAPVEAGGVKAFASAFKTIVTRDLGKAEKEPTLAEDKGVVDKIEEEKEEAKIRKRLAAHRKSLRTAFHVTEPPVLELPLEREYRRIATKGVVAVFNAVKDFRAPEPEVGEEDEDEGEEVVEKEVPSTRSSGRWLPLKGSSKSRATVRGLAQQWKDSSCRESKAFFAWLPVVLVRGFGWAMVPSRLLLRAAETTVAEGGGGLRPLDVRKVLSTLAKKRRSDHGHVESCIGTGSGGDGGKEQPFASGRILYSARMHKITSELESRVNLLESTAVVEACLRRAMARVDTFSCRSLAAIASSCVRLAEERCPELIEGEGAMPSITESLPEVDGDDESTLHVKDLAQILSACSRVSVRDAEVVAACARFIPSQCKFMDAQGLAIIWRALAKLMYSETATRVDDDGAPIEEERRMRKSCYEALQGRLATVVHQMNWQELAMVAQAASRTRAHGLCEDVDRAWTEVSSALLQHATTRLAPVSEPDAHSLSEFVHGVGLIASLQGGAANRPPQTTAPEILGLADLFSRLLCSAPSQTPSRCLPRAAAGFAALALAAVLHACALSGFGGNDTVGELGRRLAGQSWELYSFGGTTDGRNLVKTAVELWWLQGRVPARLARYLRESLKLLAPDEKRVAQLLLRLPEVRDRAPTSDKEGRTVESWSLRLLDGPQPDLVTKLLVWSPSGELVPTDDLPSLRDLIGVASDREVASAVRKVASLLAIPWEAYPTPIIRCTRPGAPDKLVNIIIVKRGGWIPSDLVVSSWAAKAPTVALLAEDSYKYHDLLDRIIDACC
ncbi:hypothetical protein FOZ60_013531 [Perkinsus olseni]|uniref:Uncharacterized protein n=1 Tax=Perkinsus olseni TaxID=32597 RepID=A0A7J6P8H1_PEROL|nr:hypothetical protein FOZ60_013531 [Perkinsus olseni]